RPHRTLPSFPTRRSSDLCILTSADTDFPQEHTRSEDPLFREPLKEFPKDLKALLEFDVIIFGDVDPGKLGPEAAKNIETFVSERSEEHTSELQSQSNLVC